MRSSKGSGAAPAALQGLIWTGLAVATAALLEVWLVGAPVRSSTGAWILAQVERARAGGDYVGAACAGMVPSAYSNALYPAGIAWVSEALGADSAAVGRWLSTLSMGLAVAAMAGLWRRIGGPGIGGLAIALAGAAALAWPPLVSSAALVRYDAASVGLTLAAIWAAARGGRAWLLAGLLAGLAYNSREFTLAMTAGGLGGAWLGQILGGRVRRRLWIGALLRSAALALLGLGLGGALPWLLGLSPFAGLAAALEISDRINPGIQIPLESRLYLDRRPIVWMLGVGATGLLAAGIRARDRSAWLGLLGALLHLPLFLRSEQQTPQYYLFAYAVIFSGGAGWMTLLPRWWMRAPPAIALAAWAGLQSRSLTPELLDPGGPKTFHTEIWPADPASISDALAWGVEVAGDAPLVIASDYIENIDALTWIEHRRPAAFVYLAQLDALGPVSALYGEELILLTVEDALRAGAEPAGGVLIEARETGRLLSRIWRVPSAGSAPTGECWSHSMLPVRGACLQLDWMRGGEAAVVERIREIGAGLDAPIRENRSCW